MLKKVHSCGVSSITNISRDKRSSEDFSVIQCKIVTSRMGPILTPQACIKGGIVIFLACMIYEAHYLRLDFLQ